MEELEVRTTFHLPPQEVYDFLIDFERYPRYSKYLKGVDADGDGGPGTRYALRFEWWKVRYVARSRVTEVDPPRSIRFELTSGITATGEWVVEPAPEAVSEVEEASRVRLVVRYDPDTVTGDAVDLPRFVSLGWVIRKAKPLIREEAERVVERIVADIEGRRRDVDLAIETRERAKSDE